MLHSNLSSVWRKPNSSKPHKPGTGIRCQMSRAIVRICIHLWYSAHSKINTLQKHKNQSIHLISRKHANHSVVWSVSYLSLSHLSPRVHSRMSSSWLQQIRGSRRSKRIHFPCHFLSAAPLIFQQAWTGNCRKRMRRHERVPCLPEGCRQEEYVGWPTNSLWSTDDGCALCRVQFIVVKHLCLKYYFLYCSLELFPFNQFNSIDWRLLIVY